MQITHEEAEHAFVMHDDAGQKIGRLEYRTGGGRLNAMHTFVEPDHRLHGHGAELVDALAAYARELHTTIVPICNFVKLEFKRHPDKYADVAAAPPKGAKA